MVCVGSRLPAALSFLMTAAAALALAGCGATGRAALPVPRAASSSNISRMAALPRGTGAVRLYVEPDDSKRVISRAILRARRSILLEMYLLTDRVLLHDLERAAAQGVSVRVILEHHPYTSSGDNPNLSAYDNLLAAEIPTHWSSPDFALTHAKAMVVDGRAAYIMTANFSRSAFRVNREFLVRDTEPADVRQVEEVFRADWEGRRCLLRDPDVPVSPRDARPLLAALIASARHSLTIYAEEFRDPSMARLLSRRARAGVHVRLLLPAGRGSGSHPDSLETRLVGASRGEVRYMPQAGLYIHAKAIVADDREAFVGSENFSAASLDRNREVGVLIADQAAIRRLQTTFDTDWRQAAP